MERVLFCRHCGELLEEQWLHCPWCGREMSHGSVSFRSVVDESLDRTEREHLAGSVGRLADISGRLNALEMELDAFLAGRTR